MRKAFIQLHLSILLAGFTGILGRLIILNEGLLVWYRLLITAVSMWLLFSFQKKIQSINIKDKRTIAGVGLLAMLHWMTFFAGIKYSNVSVALVCFSSIGFFTAITEPLLLKRKIDILEVLLGLLVMAGIYVIFHFDPQYKAGIILSVLSAFLASLFPIYNRQLMQRMNAETLMSWEIGFGFIWISLLLPMYLKFFPTDYLFPTFSDWGWLLVLAWACSVWGFILSANALKKISAFTVNLSFNLEPVYSIILAFIIFQENKLLKNSFYIGLTMICIAVILQTYRFYLTHRPKTR
jgi:drug/metabolite transporter (DMT)-like permease